MIDTVFPKYSQGILGLQIMIFSLIPYSISSSLMAKLQSSESTKFGLAPLVRISSLLILIVILGTYDEILGFSIAVLVSFCLETIILFIFNFKTKTK